jgi:hypothetical protein
MLLLSGLVGCGNRYSEECCLCSGTGGTGDEFMELRVRWPEKVWELLSEAIVLR